MPVTTAHVTEAISVLRHADTVFDFVSNHENDPSWRRGVASITHIPSGPSHLGMQTREELVLWGQKRVVTATITLYETGRAIAFETVAGG